MVLSPPGKPTSAAELLLRAAVPQSRPSDTKPRLLAFVHRIFVRRPSGCPHSWAPTWFHRLTTSLWSPAVTRRFPTGGRTPRRRPASLCGRTDPWLSLSCRHPRLRSCPVLDASQSPNVWPWSDVVGRATTSNEHTPVAEYAGTQNPLNQIGGLLSCFVNTILNNLCNDL
jgi:hypothetical protein